MTTTGERFERAAGIMARLRAPGGCPWDREQTFDSIKPYTVEETYEVLEAIDNRDWQELPGELGDLLLQVLFYSEMAREENRFSIDDVLDRLSEKLVNRHPHVFGDVEARTSGDVLKNWERIKTEERQQRRSGKSGKEGDEAKSVFDGVSAAMPALLEASKLSSCAARVGFDWPNVGGLFEKLEEEAEELRQNLEEWPPPGPRPASSREASRDGADAEKVSPELRARLEDELGDLFFVLVNLARYLSIDPESALRRTNRKFRRRFQWMEERLSQSGRRFSTPTAEPEITLEEMESLWQESKGQEGPR